MSHFIGSIWSRTFKIQSLYDAVRRCKDKLLIPCRPWEKSNKVLDSKTWDHSGSLFPRTTLHVATLDCLHHPGQEVLRESWKEATTTEIKSLLIDFSGGKKREEMTPRTPLTRPQPCSNIQLWNTWSQSGTDFRTDWTVQVMLGAETDKQHCCSRF